MRHFVLGAAALLGAAAWLGARDAAANGRPPSTSTIHFEQGNDNHIVAGMTFGLVVSQDGGATWRWMCEKAVGYSGTYDPIYAYSHTGAIFATTFDGLKVNRDGCTFDPMPSGTTFSSYDALGPDHAYYYAAADASAAMDSKIYKSTDDGATFPVSTMPGVGGDWWQSIVVAPSDASRVYLSGYRFVMGCDVNSPMPHKLCSLPTDCQDATHMNGMCEGEKRWLLFKSTNGGASYTPLAGNLSFSGTGSFGLTTSTNSAINFVGVDPTNPDLLYATVTIENGNLGDGLYKLDTATGTPWTGLLHKADLIAAVVRGNGNVVAGTPTLGTYVSTNQGGTFTQLTNAPHINCLYENSAGVVFACTQNYGTPPSIPSDGYGIMKSSDLATWSGVLKYQDIAGPVMCAAGTVQHDTCVVGMPGTVSWCGVKAQLGITSTEIDCSPPEATAADMTGPRKKGCCDTGGAGAPAAMLAGAVAVILIRRRRSRS
jgi:hypothetical protein